MGTREFRIAVMSLLVLGVAGAGCAKRPATTAADVPAPSAPTPSAPSAAPAPSSPSTTSPAPSSPTTTTADPSGSARPVPGEFAPIAELRDINFDFDKYDIRP